MRFVGAVREVEPEDVYPRGNERFEHGWRGTGGADSGDDLGSSHQPITARMVQAWACGATSALVMRMASASASASFNWLSA